MTVPPSPSDASPPWLLVVDMQRAFSDPSSRWRVPGFDAARSRILDLLPAFAGRAVFTAYESPRSPEGSWREYFEVWSEFLRPPGAEAPARSPWDLDIAAPPDAPRRSASTFSKWDAVGDLAAEWGRDVVIVGVSYECCVLATALQAVDAGMRVRVIEDAVSAVDPELHAATSRVLATRSPQLELVATAADLLRERERP